MSYWLFLVLFLVLPIIILSVITFFDSRRGLPIPLSFTAMPFWTAVLLHMIIAPTYTFLWDNYLVANQVWWYDPDMVSGIILWWVPIEEYTFFVLQPLLAGLFLLFVLRRIHYNSELPQKPNRWRFYPVLAIAIIWLLSLSSFISDQTSFTYISLELLWALPPVALQIAFGGDILRKHWPVLTLNILFLSAFLSIADSFAIWNGTWTIDPRQSLEIYMGGTLPLEEITFFLLTNTLITFGVLLFISTEGRQRLKTVSAKLHTTRSNSN